jgi:hypothetical protein
MKLRFTDPLLVGLGLGEKHVGDQSSERREHKRIR